MSILLIHYYNPRTLHEKKCNLEFARYFKITYNLFHGKQFYSIEKEK